MVVSSQVEHAVKYQDFQFFDHGMSVEDCVAARDRQADRDIAAAVSVRKGKHVSGLVHMAEAAIQAANAGRAADHDAGFRAQPGEPARSAGKPPKGAGIERRFGIKNNHLGLKQRRRAQALPG